MLTRGSKIRFGLQDTGEWHQEMMSRLVVEQPGRRTLKHFTYQHIRYRWSSKEGTYTRMRGLRQGHPISTLAFNDEVGGIQGPSRLTLRALYGENKIDVEVRTYLQLFVDELLNPFYVFQIFAIVLFMTDNYYFYATCIIVISVGSIIASLVMARRQSLQIKSMANHNSELKVNIVNPTLFGSLGQSIKKVTLEALQEVDSIDLVPGDVMVIPRRGFIMPCDAVLVSGSCITNESMLTGESLPMTKASIFTNLSDRDEDVADHGDNDHYDGKGKGRDSDVENASKVRDHLDYEVPEISAPFDPRVLSENTLFAGAQVMLAQNSSKDSPFVLALVARTGFETAKGELVRSILLPEELSFKFYRDSIKFVVFLFCMASVGMVYSLYIFIKRQADVATTVKRSLDIFPVAVSPLLPSSMTIGIYYAQARL